jgi:hypothetical protein
LDPIKKFAFPQCFSSVSQFFFSAISPSRIIIEFYPCFYHINFTQNFPFETSMFGFHEIISRCF